MVIDGYPKISGWWLTYPSEKYEFVSWDDDIPNIWKSKKCPKPPTRYILEGMITKWCILPKKTNHQAKALTLHISGTSLPPLEREGPNDAPQTTQCRPFLAICDWNSRGI